MNFVDRTLELIKKNGITKNKLLTDLELSKNSFVNWIDRGTIPSADTIVKIAEYFDVSVDYLLGLSNNKHRYINLENLDKNDNIIPDYENEHFTSSFSASVPESQKEKLDEFMSFMDKIGCEYEVVENIITDKLKDNKSLSQKNKLLDFFDKLTDEQQKDVIQYMEFLINKNKN